MKRDDLERYLERGSHFGFVKPTDTDEYLGWILLNKRKPNERYEALLIPQEDPEFVAEQALIRLKPYFVTVLELRRDVHESEAYENNDDYRVNKRYQFSNMDEVEEFVQQFGFTLGKIKWRADLNAP